MSTQDLITRYTRTLVQTAARMDWDVNAICAKAGVEPEDVLGEHDSCVAFGAQQMGIIVQEMFQRDDYLGQFPDYEVSGAFRLMCEFFLLSDTLGEALERSFRYYQLLIRYIDIQLQIDGHMAAIDIQFDTGDMDPDNLMKEWWPRMWHRLSGWMIGENIPLQRASFMHQASAPIADYESVFNCPCRFGATTTRLEFDVKWLARPINRDLSELEEYLDFSSLDLVALPQDDSSLRLRIEYALRKYFITHQEFPSIERIASESCVSSQTLRRRLKEEESCYTDIKEQIKKALITEYLKNSKLSIAEVGRLGGFAEASGLARAVKAWYGLSPRQYRQRYLEAQGYAGQRC